MKISHALMAAALVSSPLALAVPAQAEDPDRTLAFSAFTALQAGGGWSEGSITVTNKAAAEYDSQHLVLEFGAQQEIGADDLKVEFADGSTPDSWHAAPLVAMDLGGSTNGHEGLAADLTGATVKVAPHATHTFKIRIKLLQTSHRALVTDLSLQGHLAAGLDRTGQAKDWTVQASGGNVPLTGLDVALSGLPKAIPADGKAHPFQVTIKTANGFDWHLTKASFFLYTGDGVKQPTACDAEIDVQNPADGSWHRVGLEAVAMDEGDVDLTKWGTGPVDNRTFNARIALGKGYTSTSSTSIGFGFYPGAGPNHFWTMAGFAATPVNGAPACLDLAAAPAASPSAAASAAATKPAPAKASAAASSAPLAETGSDGTGLTVGIATGLLAVGATVVVAARRRGRRA
ncbi:hypothetical protein [Kitasatospora sp. NPDC057015]|uniref:hypothetical protein n=1 Tax=Kitasatospora sp. NPDC057015 TaxID=3346001 RepID=UPI003627D3FE